MRRDRWAAVATAVGLIGLALWMTIASRESGGPSTRPPENPADHRPAESDSGLQCVGQVVDANGQPVPVAVVHLGDRQQAVDRAGRYRMTVPRSGTYLLTAEAEGFVRGGPEGIDEIRVVIDGPGCEQDLVLRRPGRVTGRVETAGRPARAGLSVYYVRVRGLARSFGPYATELLGRSRGDGTFALEGLRPGVLRVVAEADGFAPAESRDLHLGDGATLAGVRIDLNAGGAVGELVPEPAAGLFGRVERPDGTAPSQAFVLVQGQARELRCDKQGRFHWPEAPDDGAILQAVSPFFETASLRTSRRGTEVVIRLGAGGSVVARVVDSAGRPVESFRLGVADFKVTGPAPYGLRVFEVSSVSDGDGHSVYGPLRPGRYRLQAESRDHAPTVSDEVEVSAAGTATVEIVLGSGGALRGAVTDNEGEAVSGARVDLLEPAGLSRRSTRTGMDGEYTLAGLSAGRRSVKVTAPGYLSQLEGGIEIAQDGEVWRDIVLTRSRPGDRFAFFGIGAVLEKRDQAILVRETIADHPAAINGLQAGDRILEVDRQSTRDLGIDQVVDLIRGEHGAEVQLEIERPGEGRFVVTFERGRVVVNDPPGR